MRILQLIHSEKIGGVYSIANGIFLNWQDQNEIFMFVMRVRNAEPNTRKNKFINTASTFREDLKNLKEFINNNQIDIVHCHANWQLLNPVLILKALRMIDVKVVFHQHALKKGTKPKYDIPLATYKGLGLTDYKIFPHWNKVSDEMKEKVKNYEAENFVELTKLNDGEFITVSYHNKNQTVTSTT